MMRHGCAAQQRGCATTAPPLPNPPCRACRSCRHCQSHARLPPMSTVIALVTLVLLALSPALLQAKNVREGILENIELREFAKSMEKDPILTVQLQYSGATVFAPTDSAFSRFRAAEGSRLSPDVEAKLASRHAIMIEATKDVFPRKISSARPELAPLYLSSVDLTAANMANPYARRNHRADQIEYYVNNALITKELSYQTATGQKQILYIIDEVITPYLSHTNFAPTALELLNQPDTYGLNDNIQSFLARIKSERMEELFSRPGNHTYFLPISAGDRSRDIDESVIKGHMIPNQFLFQRPASAAGPLIEFRSEAYDESTDDGIKVDISISNRTEANKEVRWVISSNTKSSPNPDKHRKGIVLSRVIRANIPVANGVVHIIDKPLMIIDMSLYDFINFESNSRLKTVNELINSAGDVRSLIQNQEQKTLLLPEDSAFAGLGEKLAEIRRSPEKIRELLRLHIVPRKTVSTDDVSSGKVSTIESADSKRKLLFRMASDGVLTVEGGGVTARAIQADIGATNGIVHIVDRVFGHPFQTIDEKLKTDPDLNITYQIGYENPARDMNSEILGDMGSNFTYFVPSNKAWERIRTEFPSEYKQLVENIYVANGIRILKRHIHRGEKLKISELSQRNHVVTMMGNLTIVKAPAGTIQIQWQGIVADIERPDVEAVNGVIHVIDQVLFMRRDMQVSGASLAAPFWASQLASGLVSLMLLRLLRIDPPYGWV